MSSHSGPGGMAIAGLGLTPQGKVYNRGYVGFAVDAVRLALADAGLEKDELDGLLVNPGITWRNSVMASGLVRHTRHRAAQCRFLAALVEKSNIGDPKGGASSPPDALPDACDAPASRRTARLSARIGPDGLGTPS